MTRKHWGFLMAGLFVIAIVGTWAQVQTSDFDPNDPDDYPELTTIDIDIKGISQLGRVFMLEGIENQSPLSGGGDTSYPNLVLHGVFDRQIRDWREDVIDGSFQRREIEIDLRNSNNRRVLRVRFENAYPIKFSIPPLSVDGSTRYVERIEFAHDGFTISNI